MELPFTEVPIRRRNSTFRCGTLEYDLFVCGTWTCWVKSNPIFDQGFNTTLHRALLAPGPLMEWAAVQARCPDPVLEKSILWGSKKVTVGPIYVSTLRPKVGIWFIALESWVAKRPIGSEPEAVEAKCHIESAKHQAHTMQILKFMWSLGPLGMLPFLGLGSGFPGDWEALCQHDVVSGVPVSPAIGPFKLRSCPT